MEQEQQEIGAVRAKMQCQSSETTDWGRTARSRSR
jgi:hypothetical protein